MKSIIRIFIIALMMILTILSFAQSIKFVSPIEGRYGKDFYIVNYVDEEKTTGKIIDQNCGNKTYDGHTGTDICLRSFLSMDSSYNVYAAADGKVVAVKDGLYDRNKAANGLGFGNYIQLKHKDTIYTFYAHLKKGSLQVSIGDSVKAGQKLGEVGSSGNSSDPHLHFEVQTKTAVVNPFSGSCNAAKNLWINPWQYDTSFHVLDYGFSPLTYNSGMDSLKERQGLRDTFYTSDQFVTAWFQFAGMRKDDSVKFYWYKPDGNYWFHFGFKVPQDYWYGYYYSYIYVPKIQLGKRWPMYIYRNNNLIISSSFVPVSQSAVEEHNTISDSYFTIFPNPVNNQILIKAKNDIHSATLIITDITGKEVYVQRNFSNAEIINTTALARGFYIVSMADASGKWVGKFIKD